MNLESYIESGDQCPYCFYIVTGATVATCTALFFFIVFVLIRTGTMPRRGMGSGGGDPL